MRDYKGKSNKSVQILDVSVEKIVPGGYGLAFAENLTVFVALAAVGDKLRVRIREKKGKVAFAEIVEILKPSENRQTPPCPYFGRCGGCDFQQMNYAAQLAAKVAILRDSLERIGRIEYEKEIPIIASPDDLNYRLRAQWHVDSRRQKLGYFRRHSHDVIDVETCPILAPALKEKLSEIRRNVNWTDFWAEKPEIEAATGTTAAGDAGGAGVSLYSSEIIEPTEEIVFRAASGEEYYFDARSFFQGNRFLIDDLIRAATGGAAGDAALDLFCGVGLFTLPLARKFKRVFGVEANEKAIEFARKNAERARLSNIEFSAENVGEFLPERENDLPKIDFVLLDPPRAGAEKETLYALLKLKPRRISYVSCDPSTLARDLRLLTGADYKIESITAVDLFPQTHHVETIVRLHLEDAN
ncbi:MAG TPA: class I SAM-dependent RNA methyltransferase [Pyrinomonadaceae bacterium]|nr:class I SAM-dependent RNA methyltransferase [Pyrinomonadaceae bacterium]